VVLGSSARLVVRRPRPEDEEAYLALLRASVGFHAPWFPSPPTDRDPYSSETFRAYLAGDDGERGVRYLIVLASGTLLGAINLNEIVRGIFQSAYLGYWLGAEHTGSGYLREALALVMDHAFREPADGGLGLHRLEANIMPQNRASLGVVRALGLRLEGLSLYYLKIAGSWRDHERWAILADEWHARRAEEKQG